MRHELIGLCAEVLAARNESSVGISGKIVDETQKRVVVRTGTSNCKRMFKSGTLFRLTLPNSEKVELSGDDILGRPWERIGK